MSDRKLNKILEDLVGSNIHLSYVSTAGEQNDVSGVLEAINNHVIQIKENTLDTVVILNRHGSILTSVRVLKRKRKAKTKKKRLKL